MATIQSLALKHWLRIIRRWPLDLVRPDSVSFPRIMQQRLEKQHGKTSPSASATSIKANDAIASAIESPRWNESKEMQQANVLYSLLENRYTKQYPLPQTLREPKSNPMHYDELVKELEEAPNRSWFGGLLKRIKGSLRFA